MTETLLILGGTADARELAGQVVARWPNVRAITSLAGRTASPLLPKGEIQIGGFGGAAGLAEYMKDEGVTCLIDATHPFAAEISHNAYKASELVSVNRLVLCRAPWQISENSNVKAVASNAEARAGLAPENRRVFLAIGRQDVAQYADTSGRFFLLRYIDPPDSEPLFSDCYVLTGRPGTVDEERDLLKKFEIDTLIAKNGGSPKSHTKINAAIELEIAVVLIDPPSPPPPPRVETVNGAIDWLAERFSYPS